MNIRGLARLIDWAVFIPREIMTNKSYNVIVLESWIVHSD
jgi:hypothetical protein